MTDGGKRRSEAVSKAAYRKCESIFSSAIVNGTCIIGSVSNTRKLHLSLSHVRARRIKVSRA